MFSSTKIQSRSPLQRKNSSENVSELLRIFISWIYWCILVLFVFHINSSLFLLHGPKEKTNFPLKFWWIIICFQDSTNLMIGLFLMQINSWIDLYRIGQQWTWIMHITCWQKEGKARISPLSGVHRPASHTRSCWRTPSISPPEDAFWHSRTRRLLLWTQFRKSSCHQFVSLKLSRPGATFLR